MALLSAGWTVERISDVLAACPRLVAERPDRARFYGPEMFRGERWSVWRSDTAALTHREKAPETPKVAAELPEALAARRDAEERQARLEAERQALQTILETVEHPPIRSDFEVQHWRKGPSWRARVLFLPAESKRVVADVLAALEAEGREPSAATLAHALSSLELPAEALGADRPPENGGAEPVLAELRRRREAAAREGRTLSLDELRSVGTTATVATQSTP